MKTNTSYHAKNIILCLFIFTISGCGGGGGGSTSSDTPQSIVIETVPGAELLEYTTVMYADIGSNLYLGSRYAISEVDKITGDKRTLAGNQLNNQYGYETGQIHFPIKPAIVDSYLYSGDDNGKIFRIGVQPDYKTAVEIEIPQKSVFGCCNFDGITGNSTQLFYYQSSGDDYSEIYKKELSGLNGPRLEVTINGKINVTATENNLYITNNDGTTKSLFRYSLSDKSLDLIQTNLSGVLYIQAPIAKYSDNIYWVRGNSIYTMKDSQTALPVIVNGDVGNDLRSIESDGEYIYALNIDSAYENSLYKISLSDGAKRYISTPDYVMSMTILNGKLYWLSYTTELHLYTLDQDDQPVEIQLDELTALGVADSFDSVKISATETRLLITQGNKLLVYQPTTDSRIIIYPATRLHYLHANGEAVYIAHRLGDPGISKLDLDKQLRSEEIIFDIHQQGQVGGFIHSLLLDGSYVYWLWEGAPGNGDPTKYYISRSLKDGTMQEDLFVSDSELRHMVMHDSKLYFTCLDSCGYVGWVLASLPIVGGQPESVLGLLYDPILSYGNGIFYISDTYDYWSRSLFAINVDQNDYVELLTGLSESSVYVEATDKWLYVAELDLSGIPTVSIERYENKAWNVVGAEQKIMNGSGIDASFFSAFSMTHDGSYFYYYNDGIKKVRE